LDDRPAGTVFRLIAQLIGDPGREFHALEGLGAPSTEVARGAAAHGLAVVRDKGAGPVLDATAKAAYKRRIAELREELGEAERLNDTGAARSSALARRSSSSGNSCPPRSVSEAGTGKPVSMPSVLVCW
jgi:hypothetical protein